MKFNELAKESHEIMENYALASLQEGNYGRAYATVMLEDLVPKNLFQASASLLIAAAGEQILGKVTKPIGSVVGSAVKESTSKLGREFVRDLASRVDVQTGLPVLTKVQSELLNNVANRVGRALGKVATGVAKGRVEDISINWANAIYNSWSAKRNQPSQSSEPASQAGNNGQCGHNYFAASS